MLRGHNGCYNGSFHACTGRRHLIVKKDSKMGEADSFGLVGISSTGAILGVLVTGIILNVENWREHCRKQKSPPPICDAYGTKLLTIARDAFCPCFP